MLSSLRRTVSGIRSFNGGGGSMESLPSDALLDILTRVPTESVLECKLVCKKWLALIHHSGTYFTNMHISNQVNHLVGGVSNNANSVTSNLFFACRSEGIEDSSEDIENIEDINEDIEDIDAPTWLYHGRRITDKININEKYSYKENLKRVNHPPMHDDLYDHLVGSCNGLICVTLRHHLVVDPIYILNPITREYVYLPELVVEPSADMEHPYITEKGEVDLLGRVSSGFGYVSSTKEYKVVRIHYPRTVSKGHVEVYTLGSGCGWRDKGTILFRLMTSNGVGKFVDGSIYWTGLKNVVAFDLFDEEFRFLPYPPCMINCDRSTDMHGLVALGEHLCFFLEKLRLEIWSLKKRGIESSNPKEIWCLDFDIDLENVGVERQYTWFKPLLVTENGEVVLLFRDAVLYCYDSKTTTLKMITDDEEAATDYFVDVKAIPHIHTFVSLEAMGEKSKRYLASGKWEDCNDNEQTMGSSSLV